MKERPYHPDLNDFMDKGAMLPTTYENVEQRRAVWRQHCDKMNQPRPEGMVVEDRSVKMNEVSLPIRIYRPQRAPEISPVVVYIHGGGWVIGDLDTNDTVSWGLAEKTGAVVISLHYRLAPEHPYPAAFADCYGLVKWISHHADELRVDRNKLVLWRR